MNSWWIWSKVKEKIFVKSAKRFISFSSLVPSRSLKSITLTQMSLNCASLHWLVKPMSVDLSATGSTQCLHHCMMRHASLLLRTWKFSYWSYIWILCCDLKGSTYTIVSEVTLHGLNLGHGYLLHISWQRMKLFFPFKFASQIIENLRKIQHLNQIMLIYWRKSISDTYTALDWTACLIFCSIREIGKKIAEKRECICDIFLVHAVHFIDLVKLMEAKLTKLGLTSNVCFVKLIMINDL